MINSRRRRRRKRKLCTSSSSTECNMVDAKPPPTATPGTPPAAFAGERSKIKLFMERTPSIGALKSKFLTVLGNSNELLNGISNKVSLDNEREMRIEGEDG